MTFIDLNRSSSLHWRYVGLDWCVWRGVFRWRWLDGSLPFTAGLRASANEKRVKETLSDPVWIRLLLISEYSF